MVIDRGEKTRLNGLSYKDDEEKMEEYKTELKMLANTIDNLFVMLMTQGEWKLTEQRKETSVK